MARVQRNMTCNRFFFCFSFFFTVNQSIPAVPMPPRTGGGRPPVIRFFKTRYDTITLFVHAISIISFMTINQLRLAKCLFFFPTKLKFIVYNMKILKCARVIWKKENSYIKVNKPSRFHNPKKEWTPQRPFRGNCLIQRSYI